MIKRVRVSLLMLTSLSACSAALPMKSPEIDRQTRLACEQQAAVTQSEYLARIKTPMYTGSFSRTWAGGARSDTGQWVFNHALQTCMMHATHAHPR